MGRPVLLCFILFLSMSSLVFPQSVKDMSSLHYIYLGPVLSMSYDKVEYKDWFETKQGTKNMTGTSFGGGAALNIFVNNYCGDFQLKYMRSELDFSLNFLEVLLQGKYLWQLNQIIAIGAGLGLYSELTPFQSGYKGGAGVQIPLTVVFTGSSFWKVLWDVYGRYGAFGKGVGSSRISIGSNLGIVFRVGRI